MGCLWFRNVWDMCCTCIFLCLRTDICSQSPTVSIKVCNSWNNNNSIITSVLFHSFQSFVWSVQGGAVMLCLCMPLSLQDMSYNTVEGFTVFFLFFFLLNPTVHAIAGRQNGCYWLDVNQHFAFYKHYLYIRLFLLIYLSIFLYLPLSSLYPTFHLPPLHLHLWPITSTISFSSCHPLSCIWVSSQGQ